LNHGSKRFKYSEALALLVAKLSEMPYFPATVVGHSRKGEGLTLITLDPDTETNVKVYPNEDKPAHRVGNPPE
jgi:hypothetical protein